MRKLLPFLLALTFSAVAIAQEEKPPTPLQIKRHEARQFMTYPPYGLTRVKAMIKRLKPDSEDNRLMPEATFNALPFEQKFTYVMIHGENFVQNCDSMPVIEDEDKKIFPFPPADFDDETTWSDKQRAFAKKNRTKVIALIRSTIRARHTAGINLKFAIVELKANELIPDLIATYRRKNTDHDILSVLMILMKEGKYEPFLASTSFKKLYGDEANYKSFLVANHANQQLILDRAAGFYKSLKK